MKGDIIAGILYSFAIGVLVFMFCSSIIDDKSDKEFKQKYDSLNNELKRTVHERDAFNIRFDSLNLHNKTLLLKNDSLTGELGKIKGRYKNKTSQELQKLMIDGARN
jgi:hypothetical protein